MLLLFLVTSGVVVVVVGDLVVFGVVVAGL